jgi:hypothetical protein
MPEAVEKLDRGLRPLYEAIPSPMAPTCLADVLRRREEQVALAAAPPLAGVIKQEMQEGNIRGICFQPVIKPDGPQAAVYWVHGGSVRPCARRSAAHVSVAACWLGGLICSKISCVGFA